MIHKARTSAPVAKSLPVVLRVICFILLALAAPAVRAQSPIDNGAPLGMAPGSPEGSYALSGFEDVNLYNGGLSFSFPVMQVGGRGGAGYTAHVPIDAKWMVVKNEWYDENDNLITALVPTPASGGYSAGYGPGVISVRYSQWKPEGCYIGAQYFTTYRWASVSIVFTAPDGTEHEMVDQATLGSPNSYPSCSLNGNFRGPVFVSRDEPGMTFIADAPIREAPYWGNGRVTGYLKMPDGTVYRLDSIDHNYQWGSYYELIITWMRDPNGNKTTFGYTDNGYGAQLTSIKDSLNHQITIETGVNEAPYGACDRLTYKGYGGANRVVHISYGPLSTALRGDQTIKTYKQLFPELDGTEDPYDPYVTTAIWLPDGDGVTRRYRFLYNSYGELARVELPTGGAVEYDWAAGLANGATDGLVQPVPNVAHWTESLNLPQIYRRLVARRSYDVGNVLLGSTGYGRPETQNYDNTISNVGYVTVGHYDANGQQLSAEAHYFYGSPATSLFAWQASPQYMPTYSPYPSYRDGREYQSDLLAANGSTLLRRTTQSWGQNPLFWWYGSADSSPSNRPYLKETVTTLADSGQVTKTTNVNPQTGQVMIDQFGNPLDVWVYDYGQGQPGALLRHMHTEFMTVNPVNNVDYTNRTSASSPHMLNLPTRMSVYDGNEVERARTTMEYDNYNADANHAALVDRPSISGFDSSFGIYYSTRGNATATTRYLLTNGSVTGSITGYAQYDIAGNMVKTIDARGNVETFDYADRFGSPDGEAQSNSSPTELSAAGQYSYGFATSATNAAGHTTYTQYDYYLAKAVDAQDLNGTTYSGFFNDALDRPTQVISGANQDASLKARAIFSYDDVNHVTTQTSDFNSYAESYPLKTQIVYDGVGRTTESRRYEGGSNYVAVRKRYDALGRVSQESNPFRNGETPVWTTTVYDELSRVTSVTTPDNAVSTISYSGSSVTVTDQTGKKQKSVSDALGRVTQVYEDPNGVNWLTSYTYDTLDNLTGVSQYDSVSQVTQTRTFVYDSLKRLVSSTNPESGTTTYAYDALGNLLVRTDARGVSSHASYDALNRVTRRWYNGSASTSATVNNSPALPSGVGASDEVNMFYDAQTLPAGSPPGFARGYAVGRLVAVTYGGGSAGDYFGFDAMGRVTVKVQQTGGVNYQTTSTYNNGGGRKTLTYPSGRVVNYSYDQAGRTIGFTGNLGDGVSRTYAGSISYDQWNGIYMEQFGTDTPLYHKQHRNIRGQLYDIRLSTVNDDGNWNRGAVVNYYSFQPYGFGTSGPDNNGNLLVQQHWVPNDDAISGYSFMQQNYGYDSLNRVNWVGEFQNGATNTGSQSYTYDRFGNRTLSGSGMGINSQQFSVDANTNRLGVPAGMSGVMQYDAAGNLSNDTYSGSGARTFDAENRMVSAINNGGQTSVYTYDAEGRRVRRNSFNQETWQVYGMGGELLAEYAANTSPSQPQKEYGYRNGELLISASGQSCGVGYQGTKSWGATSPALGHIVGHQEGGDWVANVSTDSAGHMSFGPYDNTFGQGHHTAKFLLQVDNTNGSDVVATLDVVTGFGGTILAQRQIHRNEFSAANQWQWFTLEFDNPCFGLVEARIYWHDAVNMRFSQLTIAGVNSAGATVEWVVSDQLGTPRMIADKTGSLAGMSRHDYLPFGEELFAGTGGRTAAQGYTQLDGVRQHFTGYERDNETGLDYAHARYYANIQGRFTGVDPVSGMVANPQTWNGYTYTLNNPVNLTDPTGMFASAEQSGPSWEVEGYPDWWKRRALWTDEIERALAVYQQMVDQGLANLRLRQQQKREQQQPAPSAPPPVDSSLEGSPLFNELNPRPTGAQVYVGPTNPVTDLNLTGTYDTGYYADASITIVDGNGVPMGPETGITAREEVACRNAQGQTTSVRQNPSAISPDATGAFPDVIGIGMGLRPNRPVRDTPYESMIYNRLNSTPITETCTQTLTVFARGRGPALTVVTERTTSNEYGGGRLGAFRVTVNILGITNR
ncbi:MAG TPA: RHS repeat-associated core domain-containing protein [Pyrinomonadaceae bacterium]